MIRNIHIAIEIRRHRLILGPTWDADRDAECLGFLWAYGNVDFPIPGINGFLLDLDYLAVRLDFGFVLHEEIDKEVITQSGINITGNRRDESRDIGWAASAGEPRAAFVLAVTFERIGIKKQITL